MVGGSGVLVAGSGVLVAAGSGVLIAGRGVRVAGAGPPLLETGVLVSVGEGVSVALNIMRVLVAEGDIVARKVGINPGVSSGEAPSTVPGPPDSVVRKAAVAGAPGSTVAPSGSIPGANVAPSGVSSSPPEPPIKNMPPAIKAMIKIITAPPINSRASMPPLLPSFAGGGAAAG